MFSTVLLGDGKNIRLVGFLLFDLSVLFLHFIEDGNSAIIRNIALEFLTIHEQYAIL
jgi:hypothetical protein